MTVKKDAPEETAPEGTAKEEISVNDSLKEQLANAESEKSDLQGKVDGLQSENSDLHDQVASLVEENERLQKSLDAKAAYAKSHKKQPMGSSKAVEHQ